MHRLFSIAQHPLARKALRAAAALAGVLLLAVLYVAFIGITIDASDRRSEIAQKFTAATGREARLEGALQLVISAHPALRVGGLHIANAVGFAGEDLASLGEARLELDLWALLLGHLQVEELSGDSVRLHLQTHQPGHSNWTFRPAAPQQAQTTETDAKPGVSIGQVLARLDIQHIVLHELEVDYTGRDDRPHFFALDTLEAQLPAGKPVTLRLNGSVEKQYPYRLDFTGGTIAQLAKADASWPVDLALQFMSSRLSLKGEVSGESGKFDFSLGSDDLTEFERLFHASLPAVGKVKLGGMVSYEPGHVVLEKLDGSMGKTTLTGGVSYNYEGKRPRVQGRLELPALDLRPFLSDKPVAESAAPPKSLAELYAEIAKARFNLKQLNSMDADLTLRVGKWLNLPGAVHDAMLQVQLKQGRLSVPMRVTAAGVTLAGEAHADANARPARFGLALGAHHAQVSGQSGSLGELPEVQGQLERFELKLSARGDTGAQLMRSLDVGVELERGKLSYGGGVQGRRVQFALDKFSITLPPGRPLQGEMRGSLLQKPFSATLHGGTLAAIMQEADTPIDFVFDAGAARAEVHALLQPPTQSAGTEVAFSLAAPHASDVAQWLGLRHGADAPVSLQGKWHARQGGNWRLSDMALQLGKSTLTLELERVRGDGRALTRGKLTSDLIDVDELQSLLPEAQKEEQEQAKPASRSLIDIPILPAGVNLADADIAVDIKRIATVSPFAVRELHFDGRLRDGMMASAPFAVHVAKTDFSGSLMLDLRTQEPHAQLLLDANTMDIGNVLGKLGLARDLDAAVEHMHLQLDLHASHLGELLAHSDMSVAFSGGHYTLRDANTGGAMRIALQRGELASVAGMPVRLDLDGAIDAVPVRIAITTATAAELLDPAKSIPFSLDAGAAGITLKLTGDVDRPFTQKDVELSLELGGARFDTLDPLLHAALPPWGPWVMAGRFHMTKGGYEVSSLMLRVGSSALTGSGRFDTRVVPPRLDVVLAADTIQLDDFRFGNWSPEGNKKPVPVKGESEDEKRRRTAAQKQQAAHLLSREVLRRQDASVKVRVGQVLSGKDVLGKGALDARLEHGHAEIGPLAVDTPGGSASMKLEYAPEEKDVALSFIAKADRFDYGILVRRANPQSRLSGVFDLDVDISAHAQALSDLLRNGKGHINFALWPENMESGVLDYWAVSVLTALLPKLDSSRASRVNCAIGEFVLADGKLTDKKIVVDTSRMRVTGKGEADFAAEKLDFYMQPRAKTPQFMSLAVPVELGGTFSDYSVGVRAADVAGTVGEFFTSFIWMPLRGLFSKAIPEDGSDICGRAAGSR